MTDGRMRAARTGSSCLLRAARDSCRPLGVPMVPRGRAAGTRTHLQILGTDIMNEHRSGRGILALLDDRRLAVKIGIVLWVALLTALAVGGVALQRVGDLRGRAEAIRSDGLTPVVAAETLRRNFLQTRRRARG